MTIGVVYFPGTNCEHDILVATKELANKEAVLINYRDKDLPADLKLLFIPGGFSFGDYLRTGAMAKVTPIMAAVRQFADNGGIIVGICNGFQILCEAGLLPGVLLPNRTTRFLSRPVTLKVVDNTSQITKNLKKDELLNVPVAHFEGNYFADPAVIEQIESAGQVIFRYASDEGHVNPECAESNPNGSINAIAGIRNSAGNVFGFMPHPERSIDLPTYANEANCGKKIMSSILKAV